MRVAHTLFDPGVLSTSLYMGGGASRLAVLWHSAVRCVALVPIIHHPSACLPACLQEAREAQAAAEGKAAEVVKVGAARRLREVEGRAEALEGTLAELRTELERQVGTA